MGRSPRRRLLALSVVGLALVSGCSDDGSLRRAADLTISVAYDGHHDATVTVRARRSLSPEVAERIIRETARQVLRSSEQPNLKRIGTSTYRASLVSIELHGIVRVDARPVLKETQRLLAPPSDRAVWLGVCIPQSRAKWSSRRNSETTPDHGCNAWYRKRGDDPAMYLHLGTIFNGTLIPLAVLFVVGAGAIATYRWLRNRGDGLLIVLLCIPGSFVALFDAGALFALRAGALFSGDPKRAFGMDPDESLHRLQTVGAWLALGVATSYAVIIVAVCVRALRARRRRHAVPTTA